MLERQTKFEGEGFTKNQLDEIKRGIKDGLDVSLYARKEFLTVQMREIRLGLLEGLPVEEYARPEYDWFQMEEIRKGLEDGVDISKYASPDISHDRMQQIRLGLLDGMNLYEYKRLDAGILKQMRLAFKHHINIVPYILEGYDAEQLEAIRTALEKGLDITPWVLKEYRGVALGEIFAGLAEGIDVSAYAKTDYNWQQMREIRIGIEHMVDIEQYSNKFYSSRQMQEIRLGLEEGLDVSYYSSLMYTAGQMHERRICLEENPWVLFQKDIEKAENEENETPEKDIDKYYTITVTEDEMEAYLEVHGSAENFDRLDVVRKLHEKGICYGILYDVVEDVISGNGPRKPLRIAEGKRRTDGKDGYYEFFFRTEASHIPKMLSDGNVDYRDVEGYELVEKGQKLAVYHNAEAGEDGITIKGKLLPAKRGKEKNILTGKGFKRLADGKTYVSELKGVVTIQDYLLNVSELLVLDEVNMATGDVEYDGNILVEGNVGSGSKIKASGDVIVKGFVENASIICDGSVFLRQGMNGSGGGNIRAGKDVVGYFFEEAEVYAGENIQGDYFFKSVLYAQGEVKAVGRKGTIAGGRICAERGLRVNDIGNPAALPTYVRLGSMDRIAEAEKKLNEETDSKKREMAILQNAHNEFRRKYTPEVRNGMDIYLKVESAIYTIEKQLEGIRQSKKDLEEEIRRSGRAQAIVQGQLFEGVTFEIDGARWKSTNVIGVVVKKYGNTITAFSYE